MPGVLRDEIRELLRANGHFVMIRAIALGGQLRVGTLVDDAGVGEAQSEAAQRPIRLANGETEHGGGVDAATEQEPYRNVGHHVHADAFVEQFDELFFRLREADLSWREMQIPILPDGRLTVFH